jgi:ABC-type multidrug transport system permease subunit
LLKLGKPPYEYYVSDTSPKGYVLEQMFKASLIPAEFKIAALKKEIHAGSIRYIDWLFPGILAMNMMFLSEVWFSLEGAPQWIKSAAQIFPLTHLLKAARQIMNDGAGLADVGLEIIVLSAMTLAFLTAGAFLFSWNK